MSFLDMTVCLFARRLWLAYKEQFSKTINQVRALAKWVSQLALLRKGIENA
jgi:hypothetical protein